MKKRVLITGGAGFIGFHLTRELLNRDDSEIVLLDDFRRGRLDTELQQLLGDPRVRLVEGDLAEGGGLEAAGKGFDEVYHLAAVIGVKHVLGRPHDVVRINALATIRLLDWCVAGGARKFFFASTSEVYAWTQHFHPLPVPTPEDVPLALTDMANPRISYAGSKIFGELAVTHMCNQAAVPFVIVRFHNVYGPRMGWEHVIPELHERVRAGQNPLVVFAADHRRAFCHVKDAVDLVLLAMRNTAGDNATINAGNDRCEVSIRELAEQIQELCGSTAPIAIESAPNDPIRRRCPDMDRARKLLGFEPRYDLKRGLSETLAWYDANPRPGGR